MAIRSALAAPGLSGINYAINAVVVVAIALITLLFASNMLRSGDPLRCLAWTYVAPGYQETSPVCWLKNAIPAGVRTDVCCTSGVAYYRRPK